MPPPTIAHSKTVSGQRSARANSSASPGTFQESTLRGASDAPQPQPSGRQALRHAFSSVGLPALLSCVALWSAFPPLGWSWMAWLAPLGWLRLIERDAAPGKAGYFWIWAAGCLFWLAILQGIRLAFWPLIFGWLAISLYLAVYLPLFVGIARVLRHRWHWSLAWSAPVAWTGMELARSYMITGYAANTLAHTQVYNPMIIQLADQFGGYSISFIMMAVCVAIYRIVQGLRLPAASGHWRDKRWDLAVPACLLIGLLGYGFWRLREGDKLAANSSAMLRAALIQENTPSVFAADPERLRQAWTRYASTTAQAVREQGPVDLVVWPESTFTAMIPWMDDETTDRIPAEMKEQSFDRQSLQDLVAGYQREFRNKTRTLLDMMNGSRPFDAKPVSGPHFLVGNDSMVFRDDDVGRYNAALLLGPEGDLVSRYEKIHLVMFGEYIPLAWALAFLGDAFGFSAATPGTEPQIFEVGNVRIAPSICFESTLPHFMSWQVRSLTAKQKSPDVLINITNDSWFHGSSILDHHLACDVLSSVELRRPFLIAANTGLSAWIEGSGRIKAVSPRMESHFIIAEPTRDGRWGLTQLWGDLPAWCLAGICVLSLVSYRRRRTKVVHD